MDSNTPPLTTRKALDSGADVIGARIRVTGWGGGIPLHIVRSTGTIVRINRNGHPVITVGGYEYTDRDECTAIIDADGNYTR